MGLRNSDCGVRIEDEFKIWEPFWSAFTVDTGLNGTIPQLGRLAHIVTVDCVEAFCNSVRRLSSLELIKKPLIRGFRKTTWDLQQPSRLIWYPFFRDKSMTDGFAVLGHTFSV